MLGVGLAATRDLVVLQYARTDQAGTQNPVNAISHSVASGTSQAGNFLKTFIHLGFNEDLDGRIVWDGIFPFIAGRQTPLNSGSPPRRRSLALRARQRARLWWSKYRTRSGPRIGELARSLLGFEDLSESFRVFGATEFWGLRMSPGLVGTDAARIRVQRLGAITPGTTHGGGRGSST